MHLSLKCILLLQFVEVDLLFYAKADIDIVFVFKYL